MFFLFTKAENKKYLISKVFSAEKMNHAKTQGGPWWLHCWRNVEGLAATRVIQREYIGRVFAASCTNMINGSLYSMT